MLNIAQKYIQDLLKGANPTRDYKAPHAYRGTPMKLRQSGRTATRKAIEERYRAGLQCEQPLKYKNRGERERILAMQTEETV